MVDSASLVPVGPRLVTTLTVDATSNVSVSPDGAHVSVATPVGVEVIDVALGRASRSPFPTGSFGIATFSPDGRRLLIGGGGRTDLRARRRDRRQ